MKLCSAHKTVTNVVRLSEAKTHARSTFVHVVLTLSTGTSWSFETRVTFYWQWGVFISLLGSLFALFYGLKLSTDPSFRYAGAVTRMIVVLVLLVFLQGYIFIHVLCIHTCRSIFIWPVDVISNILVFYLKLEVDINLLDLVWPW